MNSVDRLKKQKQEFINDVSFSDEERKFSLEAINVLIRGEELVLREQEYFDHGFYFGYVVIASQRLENKLKNLINTANKIKNEKTGSELEMVDLDRLPLGKLISKLESYILNNDLFTDLKKFNQERKMIVHHLSKNNDIDLNELESSIPKKIPIDFIVSLQGRLLDIQITLNLETNNPDSAVSMAVRDKIRKMGVEKTYFESKF